MHRWRSATFLLILAVGSSIAETVQNVQASSTLAETVEQQVPEVQADTGKSDYETALRPAVLQKRSIANIARLLLGGSVPPNHPLVKYPENKHWNLAQNIVASLPGSSLATAASSHSEGWGRQPSSALQNIQQLFETKAKIIPYTGQVATGLTGLASVKGDLIRQIHSISTQAIAQAAAEAAARALASAAAAHAVTNSIAHSVNPGAQTGIKGGWSSYQNTYAEPSYGKTPGEQPGPPYHDSSAHINHYQPPPSAYGNNPSAYGNNPSAYGNNPSAHGNNPSAYGNNPSAYGNNPYAMPATTPSPAVPPTLPSPAGYPAQTPPQQPYQNGYYTLYNTQPSFNGAHAQTPYTPAPPVPHARPTLSPNTLIATTPSVPAGIFGRNAAQPSSTSSLLSSISSLLSASTAAYNAAISGAGQQQQPSALFSTLLPSASSTFPGSPTILRPSSPGSVPSVLGSGISSSAFSNGYQQQPANSLSQSRGNYGGYSGSISSGHLQYPAGSSYPSEARASSVNSPSYSINQHGVGYTGGNYAQPGTNSYTSQSVQSSPHFSSGIAATPGTGATANSGNGAPVYSTTGSGFPGTRGSGNTGYNGGAGPSTGHVNGWNTQHAGPSPSASTWPGSGSPNVYPPGYAGQTSGNINNLPGGYAGAAQFPVASGSSFAQQTYPAPQANAYQPSAPNSYAQAQSFQSTQLNSNPVRYQSPSSNADSVGGVGNSDITQQRHDLRQSASTMGHDYDDETNDDLDENTHHSYQQAQRRHRPESSKNSYNSYRYPSPGKKKTSAKRPSNSNYSYSSSSSSKNSESYRSKQKNRPGNDAKENGKPFIPTGSKKGSQFDSSVDVVDASVDDYNDEDRYYDSDELRNHKTDPDTNKNRWRTKNTSGQRPNTLHNHNSNGRWSGKATHTKQTPPKNVRGNGGGPERPRPQSGQSKGGPHKDHRSKKGSSSSNDREQEKKRKHQQMGKQSKTEAAKIYEGRIRNEQQQSTKYKSRDVYTTLPEYVFRKGERTDIFLRPDGKRKQGSSVKGRRFLRPRVGETDGDGSGRTSSPTKEDNLDTASSNIHPYDEALPQEGDREEDMEKSPASSRKIIDTPTRGSEEEEFVSISEAIDETARSDDILSDQIASNTGFLTSEEFDPEEREAFVEDVYADDHNHHHHPQRRQEYDEERIESNETTSEDSEKDEEDWADKK